MTVTSTVTVVQGEEKFTAKVPRVVFKEVTEKADEPPAVIFLDAGEIARLIGPETVTKPVLFGLMVIVPVPPPFFLIESEDGLAPTVQPPDPVPVIGGPAAPPVPAAQSAALG